MEAIEAKIRKILHEQCGVSANAIRPNAHLSLDLGLDSLDVAELMLSLEKELRISIPDSDWQALDTVHSLTGYVQHKVNDALAYA